ncbi:acyltransferase [Actinomycetospora chlora]|uniref:Acyltransferase n=1 Tax=Actinomycetospora chlora TaxID=663608 RepID=A0ABP9AZJ5_9PSEU
MTVPRENAFDLLRLVGVVLVLVHHSWVLTGSTTNLFGTASGTDPGTLGVGIFFATSGYLVTGSWLADPSPWRFLARRALRLWPLLIVVVLGTAVVLGPLVTALPISTYLRDPATPGYVLNNVALWPLQWTLPGVLGGAAVNGSIWSLPWEAMAYGAVVLLGSTTLLRRPAAVYLLAAAAVAHLLVVGPGPAYVEQALACFTLGMAAQHACRRWVPSWWVAVGGAALWAATWGTTAASAGSVVFIGSSAFVVALRAPACVRHPTGSWDLSYGMYLTAFPIQQLAVVGLGWRSPWLVLLVALVGSAACAAVSWPLIERPALRHKPHRCGPRVRALHRRWAVPSWR